MKLEDTKNYKALEEAYDSCSLMGDTALIIYQPKDSNEMKIMATGREKVIARAVRDIFVDSLDDDAEESAMRLGNAILNGICEVLSAKNLKSMHMLQLLGSVLHHANEVYEEAAEEKNREPHAEHNFDPYDEDCKECADYPECLMKYLKENNIDMRPRRKNNKKRNG